MESEGIESIFKKGMEQGRDRKEKNKPSATRSSQENSVSYTYCPFGKVVYAADDFDCKDRQTNCNRGSVVVLHPVLFSGSPEKQKATGSNERGKTKKERE